MNTTTIPRPEHPQPQFERADWINLNGEWTFALDPGRSGLERDLARSRGFERTILVPFCSESALSGVGHTDFIEAIKLGQARAHAGQPLPLDEFGGIKWQPVPAGESDWDYGDSPKSLDEFYARLAELVDSALAQPGYSGYCYTQLTDVEQEVNGIYTYDRTPKFDMERIRAILERNPGHSVGALISGQGTRP